jgi:phosphoglycerate kinase
MRPITVLDDENIEGKTVLVRVDYNVPIQNGVITDDFRIKSSLRTIEYLRNKKAKVVIIAHIEGKGADSLEAVAAYPFAFPIHFEKEIPVADTADGCARLKQQLSDFKANALAAAPNGSVFLFESLRKNPGETANDPEFAAALASIADIFVGDAFSVAHRKHASIVGIPALLPHYAGFQIMEEVVQLERGLNPNHPFVFVLGGAKFDTKLPLIEKFMHKADKVLIAGALLNDIMAGRGMEVGKSLVSNTTLPDEILKDPDHKLINLTDVTVKNMITGEKSIKKVDIEHGQVTDPILPDDNISDAGPSAIAITKEIFDEARAAGKQPFVLWNGPLGNYEEGFPEQTIAFAKLIMESKVDALIGGGDTTAAISKLTPVGAANAEELGVYDKSGVAENHLSHSVYISTGGGAMIDYLIDETLVGIEALK